MERHLILHDITGSFLLVESQVENQQSPTLPSLTDDHICEDVMERNVYSQVSIEPESCSLDIPLTVRYNLDDAKGGSVATVYELLRRRCAIALNSSYKWTPINTVFLQHIKDSYSPLVWHAINNIADETLENEANVSVPVFTKRGFVKRLRNTISSRLQQCGRGGAFSVMHETVSSDASVFSVHFEDGEKESLYYKITEPSRPEALFTQALGRLMPELIVIPIEVDVTSNSFFTEDFGDTVEYVANMYDEEPGKRKKLVRPSVETIAEFHQKASKHVEELRKLGMEDTSPQQMRIELPDFVSKVEEMGILTEAEAQFMRKGLPKLFSFLEELANGKIPRTICHGDLHEDNVAMPASEEDKPLLFDWYYSTISHPFFDILYSRFKEPELLELYYEKWTSYDSLDEIRRLGFVARCLEPLWGVFRRVKIMRKRKHQLGAEEDLSHCRGVLKGFLKELLYAWLNE